MGIRGELFSTKITCEGRTYFFNVKQNRMNDVFLTIVESKPTEAETFDRRSIVLFREDVSGFLKAFQGALKFMEKPGAPPPSISFSPQADLPAPRRPRSPRPASPTEGGKPEVKRRIVVKRKSPGSEAGEA